MDDCSNSYEPLEKGGSRSGAPRAAKTGLKGIILDDSRIDQLKVGRVLAEIDLPMETTFVYSVADLRSALDSKLFDIAFVDYRLTMETGLDAVRAIKQHRANANLPIIMLATEAPTDVVVDAIRMGCSTFLTKDRLDMHSLGSAIFSALEDLMRGQADGPARDALRKAMAAILTGVAKACEEEFRPTIKRLYRTNNFIRECQNRGLPPDPSAFDVIDTGCLHMARFLDELETYAETWGPAPARLS